MSEEENYESGSHITVSSSVLYMLLASALGLGAGGYGILGPKLETEAIRACFDNSQTALNVTAQHGQEFVDVRRLIQDTTRDRYTGAEAEKDRREQDRRDATQDRRIDFLENRLEMLEDNGR